jgi:hypothetical protein
VAAAAREYFTVDLRGQRAALAARAAREGVTESDVLRSALAAALGTSRGDLSSRADDSSNGSTCLPRVKLSVRLMRPAACRLDEDSRASGFSRGAYLARLIQAAPPVASSADRVAMCTALNNSSGEMAVMSRDIARLTLLLRQGSVEAATSYAARLRTLDRDVRSHLALVAAVLADLSAMGLATRRRIK